MTGLQRNKVIELNKQCRQGSMNNNNNNPDAHSVSQINTSVSVAIIIGVTQARQVDYDDNMTEDDRTTSLSTKCKAESGSVGNFIASCCKKSSKYEDWLIWLWMIDLIGLIK